MDISELKPYHIWKNFSGLNAIPRPSKKEEKVCAFMVSFGKELGLEVKTDEVGNVLIRKPATVGMENRKSLILQSHLDMVCQKNNNVDFDFETMGIEMLVEEGFVKAKGTTLGADNGIGVAAIMSILESKDIAHPAIEAFFTIDEETGMMGALGLKSNFLTGDILLNLDTEEDDSLNIGCAGGIDVTASATYKPVMVETDRFDSFQIYVKGLQGGHSGMDIHKGFGNANKILARFLYNSLTFGAQLAEMDSGGLRNAIPREGYFIISLPSENKKEFYNAFEALKDEVIEEYKSIEKDIQIDLTQVNTAQKALSKDLSQSFANVLLSAYNGVFRMSPEVAGLVETSNNVAKVEVGEGSIKILCLTRSSIESGKRLLADTLKATFNLAGFKTDLAGDYPGWKPNFQSEILELMKEIYLKKYGEEPAIVACHAGLECGIIGRNYPGMEMISFGPNIYGAHSPDERVEIKSVEKFWDYLLTVIEKTPIKL